MHGARKIKGVPNSTFASLTEDKMLAESEAWFKMVVLSLLMIHGCVLGVTCNKSECHLPSPVKARCVNTLVDCYYNGGFAT